MKRQREEKSISERLWTREKKRRIDRGIEREKDISLCEGGGGGSGAEAHVHMRTCGSLFSREFNQQGLTCCTNFNRKNNTINAFKPQVLKYTHLLGLGSIKRSL